MFKLMLSTHPSALERALVFHSAEELLYLARRGGNGQLVRRFERLVGAESKQNKPDSKNAKTAQPAKRDTKASPRKASPRKASPRKAAALYDALVQDNVAEMRRLLDDGADPNSDYRGNRMLVHAVDNLAMVRLLLERGADPNRGDAIGPTPVTACVAFSRRASLNLLLAAGADLSKPDASGFTIGRECLNSTADPVFMSWLLKKAEQRAKALGGSVAEQLGLTSAQLAYFRKKAATGVAKK
jgi:ankyrin repeat protein